MSRVSFRPESGQEKYSTEVVLQRFRGELTMLDTRGGGDTGGYSDSYGGSSQGDYDAPSSTGGGGDLDDDIPF